MWTACGALRVVWYAGGMRACLLVMSLALAPAAAHAEDLGWHLWMGLGFHHVPEVDLAAVAEAEGRGAGNDASPGALGVEMGTGLEVTPTVLLGAHVAIGRWGR